MASEHGCERSAVCPAGTRAVTGSSLTGKFVILDGDQLRTYTRYADIPDVFDCLISFEPHVEARPVGPPEHELLEDWHSRGCGMTCVWSLTDWFEALLRRQRHRNDG